MLDLLDEMEKDKGDIDSLFRELDTSLQHSRALPDVVVREHGNSNDGHQESASSSGIMWHDVLRTANNIAIKDCPICMQKVKKPCMTPCCKKYMLL